MSEAELRQVLKGILELGMIGRLHPDEPIETPECGPLLIALGTIAGLATVALEGLSRPPEQLELIEEEFAELKDRNPVILRTSFGFGVELTRK